VEDPEPTAADSLTVSFEPPKELLAFRLQDPSRVVDVATRPYCVQYNESDLDFVGRLLAEEGISYHFEHHAGAVVMVLSDSDAGRTPLDPFDPIAIGQAGRQLESVRLGRRLRPSKVRLVDYNWQKPALDMKVEATREGDASLEVSDYPGLYPDQPKQGELLVKARVERLETESRYAEVVTGCRLLGAGSIFAMAHEAPRYEGEYLVTRARIVGTVPGELSGDEQLGAGGPAVPFKAQLECVRRGNADGPAESKYRPPLRPKPRIVGSQTAVVTADPGATDAEIHVGGPEGNENGCVRLRFHWDLETERHEKEPTSAWVRVSQAFAGAGGGALFHPRVGTECVVEFLDGDPDRPLVVGRVYNGQQLAPAKGKGAATVSTIKSLASPGGKVFNELSFDDTAGEEKVNLTAGKDWNSAIGNNRTETVQNDSTSSVLANRKEDTSADRTTSVGGSNSESVAGDESVSVSGSRKVGVSGDQSTSVSGSQTIGVGGDRGLSVGGSNTIGVGGSQSVSVGASETVSVAAAQDVSVGASKTESIGAAFDLTVGAAMTVSVGGPHTLMAPVDTTKAPVHAIESVTTAIAAAAKAAVQTVLLELIASGTATLQGATVDISSGGDVTISGASIAIKGGTVSIEGGSVNIAGGTTNITGSVVSVN
jgi:type VI secretion system secreted protein VgrG